MTQVSGAFSAMNISGAQLYCERQEMLPTATEAHGSRI